VPVPAATRRPAMRMAGAMLPGRGAVKPWDHGDGGATQG